MPWPPPPRAPLPPFPSPTNSQPGDPQAGCWTYSPFDPALPFTPTDRPDLDFHRGNVMGVRVPGKPYVPGETDRDPSFLVTWFLYLQTPEWQTKILDHYQHVCGYTHINFHLAAWLEYVDGVPGCSTAAALDLVRRCKARGLYVTVNLAVDNGAPDRALLEPWMRDLAAAGMVIGCLAWQADQRMSPLDLCDYIAWAAPLLHDLGCKVACHWVNEACAWWNPADCGFSPNTCDRYGVCDRFAFQAWTADKIDYQYAQFNVDAPILDDRPRAGGLLGAIQDLLRSFRGQRLVIAEYDMQAEFDEPLTRTELYGDLKGRALLATSYQGQTVSGYFNGARRPDGRVL